jgi:hypothetical protein
MAQQEARTVQMPEEWGGVIPSQVFLDEAKRIVEEGEKQGLILRVLGGVAIRLHTLDYVEMGRRLGRLGSGEQEFTDLDFMSYFKQRREIEGLLTGLGYGKRKATLSSAASRREIYFHPQGWFFLDIFFDKLLVANHPLDFRGRLELDSPTISVTDLLLEKLQIVGFSEKDLKDTLVLLMAHEIGERDEREMINARYIAKLLAGDWGFWYTVTTNLRNIKTLLPEMEAMTEQEAKQVASRIDELMARIDEESKSLKWKLRAPIGTKMTWYEPVETGETIGEFGIWRPKDLGKMEQ